MKKGKVIIDDNSNTNFSFRSSSEGSDITVDGDKTPNNKLPHVLKTKRLTGYSSGGARAKELFKNNAEKWAEELHHGECKVTF